jgi:hypothetical protein
MHNILDKFCGTAFCVGCKIRFQLITYIDAPDFDGFREPHNPNMYGFITPLIIGVNYL